jgi:hypothetical protein
LYYGEFSLGVGSFCWAKVGKAKLIANPARATTKRIFIVFSRVGHDAGHLAEGSEVRIKARMQPLPNGQPEHKK